MKLVKPLNRSRVRELLIKPAPIRTCIVTGQTGPSDQLIRFVVSADGIIFPDIGHKLDGRGAWVTASRQALEQALKTKRLEKVLKATALVPDLIGYLDKQLLKRVQHMLGMGRKAGVVIGGAGKISASKDSVTMLLAATDASEREARGLKAATGADIHKGYLTGEELGQVFGRTSLAFVACLEESDGFQASLDSELCRLRGIRVKEAGA